MTSTRHTRSAVGLHEALQACAALGVRGGREAQWLAESLGLVWTVPNSGASQGTAPPPTPPVQPPPAAQSPPAQPARKLQLLEPVSQEPIAFERVFESHTQKIRSATELKPATSADLTTRPAFQPLFEDRWFQGIVSAMLATLVPSRDMDIRQLQRRIGRGEPFESLPIKMRARLRKGVHLLLDRSDSMQPFWRDQAELLTRLRRLLNASLVQHTWFEYDPLRPLQSRLNWRTPPPKQFREETPVVLVTDFGIGAGELAQTMEWEPWEPVLQLARSNHCRVFALIAAPTRFWPASLKQFVDCPLVWDRETSPQTAARVCRR